MRPSTTTPFGVTSLPSISRDDEELALVVVAGSFDWPTAPGQPLTLCDEQRPPKMTDEYLGDPTASSLQVEGQSAYTRPGTDIYVTGHAWTPGGHPHPYTEVRVRVGPCQRRAFVIGERVWIRNLDTLVPSRPIAFERMPLVYERSFGGVPPAPSPLTLEIAQHNPVGCGLYDIVEHAEGRPLPNIEDLQHLIERFGDRPSPVGFGPIARHWFPRRHFVGTYDQAWREGRAPLWPRDMDERLFCAASPGLCATPHLRGGELVELVGLTPDDPLHFALPTTRLQASFEFRNRIERRPMVLDAVAIDGDARTLTMIWRVCIGAQGELLELVSIQVDAHGELERLS